MTEWERTPLGEEDLVFEMIYSTRSLARRYQARIQHYKREALGHDHVTVSVVVM